MISKLQTGKLDSNNKVAVKPDKLRVLQKS